MAHVKTQASPPEESGRDPAGPSSAAPPLWRGGARIVFATFGFLALRFLLTPIRLKALTNLLSKEDYGAVTLIGATVAFLVIVTSLGGFEFMLRRLPGLPRAAQFGIYKGLLRISAGVLVAIGLAGAAWFSLRPPAAIALTPAGAFLCAALLVLTGLLIQRTYLMLGRGAYARTRILQVLQADLWFLPLALVALATGGGASLTAALAAWVLWVLATLVFTLGWAPLGETMRATVPATMRADLLAFGLPLLPMILGDWLFRLIDQYVILGHRGTAELASYALAVNTAMVGFVVGTASLDILVTEFNRHRNAAGAGVPDLAAHPELRRAFSIMVRHAFAIGIPVMAALWMLGRPVILAISRSTFEDAVPVLAWASFQPVLFMLNLIFGRVLISLDRRRSVGGGTLAAAGIALALNLAFVPGMGGRGAALANAIALAALTVWLATRLRAWRWLSTRELRPGRLVVLAGVCFGGLAGVAALWGDRPWLALAAGGAVCAAALPGLGLIRLDDFKTRPATEAPHAG